MNPFEQNGDRFLFAGAKRRNEADVHESLTTLSAARLSPFISLGAATQKPYNGHSITAGWEA